MALPQITPTDAPAVTFDDLDDLHRKFRGLLIKELPQNMSVAGVKYQIQDGTSYSFKDMLTTSTAKPMVMYTPIRSAENEQRRKANNLADRIVLIWTVNNQLQLVPASAKDVSRARLVQFQQRQGEYVPEADMSQTEKASKDRIATAHATSAETVANLDAKCAEIDTLARARIAVANVNAAEAKARVAQVKAKAEEEEILKKQTSSEENEESEGLGLGKSVNLIILGLNDNQPIEAKLDTGADVSSLHATDIKTGSSEFGDSKVVSFVFGAKKYRMDVRTWQAIKSADGGTERRPVVALSIRVNGKDIKDVLFNLNDRSSMDQKVLLGLNALEKMGINLVQETDQLSQFTWDCLQIMFEDVSCPDTTEINADVINKMIREQLQNGTN